MMGKRKEETKMTWYICSCLFSGLSYRLLSLSVVFISVLDFKFKHERYVSGF